MMSFGVAGTGKAAGKPAPQPRRRALAAMLSLAILVVSRRLWRQKRLRAAAAAQGHGQSAGEAAGDRLP